MEKDNPWEKLISHDDHELVVAWIKILIKDEVFTPDPSITYTTSMILSHLPNVQDKKVLDVGCGTWIIGIQCLKKWATNVVFSDVDMKALRNTELNLKTNWLENNSTVRHSDLFENIPESFDYIFANLPILNEVFNLKEKTENISFRFLEDCKTHLNPNWKIFIPRGSFADIKPFLAIIQSFGYPYKIIEEKKLGFTWYLIELRLTITSKDIYIGLQKPRAGRVDKRRNVPKKIAETVWQHSKKVEKAAELYGKHFPDIDQIRLKKIAKNHDLPERKEKDYKPGEISKEEKHRREKIVMVEIENTFGDKWKESMELWMEYEEQKTVESQIVMQLDKLDAAIQAIEYEKMWYDVAEFYPYTLGKLQDPILTKILHILLEKQYPHIDAYTQYFFLLEHNGDEVVFHTAMQKL